MMNQPIEPNADEKVTITKNPKSQWKLVTVIYLIIAIFGASNVVWFENPRSYLVAFVTIAVLGTIWAVQDSSKMQIQFRSGLPLIHIVFFPMSLLIYLAYSRGWKGVGLFIANVVAYVVVFFLSFQTFFQVLYFFEAWDWFDEIFFEP